ncbi:unnamed protein product [Brachionus calyciflorus]|uniref:G-protein coupled receptors family 1 profile domain-containing protein n=1 Tax=Brachionus calyciflorus TaxID=104777 RepID=A0A814AT44_9BILA|nr:unnamed protein product [Brachionus calyciflorus]
MSGSIIGSICIKSLDELNEFSKHVEESLATKSFFNVTNSTIETLSLRNIIKISLYTLFILLAIIGNFLIILVICFNRFMRKSTNYFILNLAICDLAIVFSCMWVQMVQAFNKFWILGEFFCKFNSFLQMVSVIASVLTLALISCDRYFGIAYPFKPKLTSKCTFLFIFLIWMISFLISMPSFIYRTYTERKWLDIVETQCNDLGWPVSVIVDDNGCVKQKTQPLKRIYFTIIILVLFFLPIFIMSITYSILIYKLSKAEVLGERYSEEKRNFLIKRKKVIIMLIWILVIFFVCWSPLETMLLLMEYTHEFPAWWNDLEWISYFLAYSNTVINPLIYAGLSENYKIGLRQLRDKLFRKPMPQSNRRETLRPIISNVKSQVINSI